MTPEEEIELDARLDRIEEYAEQDHKELVELRKEFDALRSEFTQFRDDSLKTQRLLMWFTEQVRAIAKVGERAGLAHAEALDTKAREILEELKTRLSQSQ